MMIGHLENTKMMIGHLENTKMMIGHLENTKNDDWSFGEHYK